MAATYGPVNLVSSFGFTARWRQQVIEGLPLESAHHVVDLMSGMGELWRSLARHLNHSAIVTGIDISPEMTRRSSRAWPFLVRVDVTDVLTWAFEPGCADVVVSSFGLKTFDLDQQERLAQCVARLLRPGGTFSFVEISVPSARSLRFVYMLYLKYVISFIGRVFLGSPQTYSTLGAYTAAFGNCDHFARCLRDAGLDATPMRYFFGCATGVRGIKPSC
jgi:ubiquinone/menaquinone biosynthesis C-methylase UbiE